MSKFNKYTNAQLQQEIRLFGRNSNYSIPLQEELKRRQNIKYSNIQDKFSRGEYIHVNNENKPEVNDKVSIISKDFVITEYIKENYFRYVKKENENQFLSGTIIGKKLIGQHYTATFEYTIELESGNTLTFQTSEYYFKNSSSSKGGKRKNKTKKIKKGRKYLKKSKKYYK
jgi:hypothetical protein